MTQKRLLQQLSRYIAHIVNAIYVCQKQRLCFYEQGDGLPCGTSLHYYESIEDSFPNKVFSVAHYLGLRAVALLTVSDIHPIEQEAPKWEWHMTEEAFLFSGAK